MKIIYVTGNPEKFEEATHILDRWELERIDMDLCEIQGDGPSIARRKALDAVALIVEPVIVEDVSFSCPALGGLPGPYIKDFLRSLGEEGLYELVAKFDDRSATVTCHAAYVEPGGEPILFEGSIVGTVVPPQGQLRHGKHSWNPIFQPEGMDKTMGQLTMAEHAGLSMRKIALEKLCRYLEGHAKDSS